MLSALPSLLDAGAAGCVEYLAGCPAGLVGGNKRYDVGDQLAMLCDRDGADRTGSSPSASLVRSFPWPAIEDAHGVIIA